MLQHCLATMPTSDLFAIGYRLASYHNHGARGSAEFSIGRTHKDLQSQFLNMLNIYDCRPGPFSKPHVGQIPVNTICSWRHLQRTVGLTSSSFGIKVISYKQWPLLTWHSCSVFKPSRVSLSVCVMSLVFPLQLGGCGILGVGVWLSVTQGNFATLSASLPSLSAANLLIALGTIIMVIGCLGCVGAVKESRPLLLAVSYLSSWGLLHIWHIDALCQEMGIQRIITLKTYFKRFPHLVSSGHFQGDSRGRQKNDLVLR